MRETIFGEGRGLPRNNLIVVPAKADAREKRNVLLCTTASILLAVLWNLVQPASIPAPF
jgi:hypothetical protein